ncbi:MAG: hypothetical protein Q9220_006262 [cf. Caloplaca sp. 1 TL-2023]
MPQTYQSLLVRLKVEQIRLLKWGESIGILEDLLEQPNQNVRGNRNLMIEILLDIQALFKGGLRIQTKYDNLVKDHNGLPNLPGVSSSRSTIQMMDASSNMSHGKGIADLLKKTLKVFDKADAAVSRLQWAAIDESKFETLVKKLVGHNEAIESLLDRDAIRDIQLTTKQNYMAMLQLNNKMNDLQVICSSLQISAQTSSSTDHASASSDNGALYQLALFKAQVLSVSTSSMRAYLPLQSLDISIRTPSTTRSEATFKSQMIWVEWKQYRMVDAEWNNIVEDRVKRLAVLLGSANKPDSFHAPRCLGYFNDEEYQDGYRFGLAYEKPGNVPAGTEPTSLLHHFISAKRPSLTKRIALAHAIASSLFHLHAVNWLHKGIRSDSIVFFVPPGTDPDYSQPMLCGFDYSRPDVPEAQTEPPPENPEYECYRHPRAQRTGLRRSRKTYDMYSLGIVLLEIAFWKPIDSIMHVPEEPRAARRALKSIRSVVLGEGPRSVIEEMMGDEYYEAFRRCILGTDDLRIDDEKVESDGILAAELQQVFHDQVIRRLCSIMV